jgi:hypothetical protein
MELLLIIANIGTAVVLFPILRRQNESVALGYVTARIVECTFIAGGILAVLTIVTLGQETSGADAGRDRLRARRVQGLDLPLCLLRRADRERSRSRREAWRTRPRRLDPSASQAGPIIDIDSAVEPVNSPVGIRNPDLGVGGCP